MKRYWLFLLAITLAIALPRAAWADVEIVKTADGTTFKFGLHEKFMMFSNQDHDLLEEFNFRSFVSPDQRLGGNTWAAQNFANLTFTLERGPLRIHANLEQETGIDAAVVDINNPNIERFALYYKLPDLGTVTVGFDVRALDPEGGLVYTDEHPGIWLNGGDDDFGWSIGWHRVLDCNRGTNLFGQSPACDTPSATGAGNKKDETSDLFANRLNIGVGDGWTISPILVYYRRHINQASLNEFSCPRTNSAAGATGCFSTATFDDPSVGEFANSITNSKSDQFRPGAVIKGDLGPATLTFQGASLLGTIDDLDADTWLGANRAKITDDFDLRAFAFFFEAALDGDAIGMEGFTPYINFEFMSGDDDPFDDTYNGYVPISNLSAALRKDGFKGQSISSWGPPVLGANTQDGWGFDVTARGVGPSIGGILPDETRGSVGGDATHFNNRGGKAGNPGHFKFSGGLLGKFAENWDTHIGISAMWYHKSEGIQAEAAQNCLARETFGCSGDPLDVVDVRAAALDLRTSGVDLDQKFMGVEINANLGYTLSGGLRIQPFVSVFFPGDIVDDLSAAFLTDPGGPLRKNSRTGVAGGFEISASF